MFFITGEYSKALVTIDNIEESVYFQIQAIVNHPAFSENIVIMPDCHTGIGSVIGFTMPMTDKVVPNTIGVDIGCGMVSVNIGKPNKLKLEKIDSAIKSRIPSGFSIHKRPKVDINLAFDWKALNVKFGKVRRKIEKITGKTGYKPETYSVSWLKKKSRQIGIDYEKTVNSIGTLGGGNHFIEIGKSVKTDDVWVTVHSGSRHFGLCVANYHQKIAKSYIAKKGISVQKGLEYLEGDLLLDYIFDMLFAQAYAHLNRMTMLEIILDILNTEPVDTVESVHNYIDMDDLIIRKGAIRSYEGERMIIPFNMRDGLLICVGKSNPEWNFSAPHGAGRVMGRREAKRRLSLEVFKKQMKGIVSSSVCKSTLDEAPDAYKDPLLIEKAIEPTAFVLDRIKPLLNIKAT